VDVKSRREEYTATTRAAILEAATERFGADGFAGTTVDAVAETARVTKGAVYHHFSDKADLLEAVFIRLEERLVTAVATAVEGIADPREEFAKGVDAFLYLCRDPAYRRIALEEAPAALGWARWKAIEERYFLGLVIGSLEAMAGAGLIPAQTDDLAARMLLASLTEAGLAVASASYPDEERVRVGALIMRFVDALR